MNLIFSFPSVAQQCNFAFPERDEHFQNEIYKANKFRAAEFSFFLRHGNLSLQYVHSKIEKQQKSYKKKNGVNIISMQIPI